VSGFIPDEDHSLALGMYEIRYVTATLSHAHRISPCDVYEDPFNPANPNFQEEDKSNSTRKDKLEDQGMAEMSIQRASIIVDIKRKSLSRPGEQPF
jgi:hypothetical protein